MSTAPAWHSGNTASVPVSGVSAMPASMPAWRACWHSAAALPQSKSMPGASMWKVNWEAPAAGEPSQMAAAARRDNQSQHMAHEGAMQSRVGSAAVRQATGVGHAVMVHATSVAPQAGHEWSVATAQQAGCCRCSCHGVPAAARSAT